MVVTNLVKTTIEVIQYSQITRDDPMLTKVNTSHLVFEKSDLNEIHHLM